MSLLMALAAAGLTAAIAWRAGALDAPGAVTAAAVGVIMLASQDWAGGVILLAFFIPTSLVSRLLPDSSARLDAKGNKRDPWQVLANGGAAALGALLWPHSRIGIGIAGAALAAAAADTWATSWGSGSARPPRSIATGRVVPRGSSGGISWRGTAGGSAGAAVVALTAGLVSSEWRIGVMTWAAGATGMLFDSLLGALVQGRFHCDRCGRDTERRLHTCGAQSRLTGGVRWLNNDAVNVLATGAAGLAGWLILRA